MTCQIMLGIYGRRKNRTQAPKLQSDVSTMSDRYFAEALLMYTSCFFLLRDFVILKHQVFTHSLNLKERKVTTTVQCWEHSAHVANQMLSSLMRVHVLAWTWCITTSCVNPPAISSPVPFVKGSWVFSNFWPPFPCSPAQTSLQNCALFALKTVLSI